MRYLKNFLMLSFVLATSSTLGLAQDTRCPRQAAKVPQDLAKQLLRRAFRTIGTEADEKKRIIQAAENSKGGMKDLLIPTNLSLTSLAPTSDESTPKQKESQEKETQSIPSSDKNAKAGCFRESDPPALVQEKRNWKSFSPDADLVVDLPDNVCTSGGGFIAASEGVMYSISTMERPQISLSPDVIDRVLNTLARTFAGFRSRTWVDNGPANSFEIKLLRKEEVNGQPGKVYQYTLASCSERKGGEFLK